MKTRWHEPSKADKNAAQMPLSGLIPSTLQRLIMSPPALWRLNLFYWGLASILAFVTRLGMGQPVGRAIAFTIVLEGSALLLSLVLQVLYRRTPREFGLVSAFRVILLSLAAAITQAIIAAEFTLWTGWDNPLIGFFVHTVIRLIFMWGAFMVWSLGFYWLWAETDWSREKSRRKEAQREAQRMELQMLRAQLDPHFLFNSLNGIAAEIHPHPRAATEMVGELSDYLRYSLDHRKQPISRLTAEIDAMEAYLKIERARFGERLSYKIEATDSARMQLIPSFLLQALVENAVKHGMEEAPTRLEISIVAGLQNRLLEIVVSNTGHLLPSDPSHQGLGLETLERRLDLHYPRRHQFILAEQDGHVVATLRLSGSPCSA